MKQSLFRKIHNAIVFVLLVVIAVSFSIAPFDSDGSATTDAYDNGYDHGCDDAGIADPSDRYINQSQKGPAFHTNEFMAGYYAGFDECSDASSNRDGAERDDSSDEDLAKNLCIQSTLLCQQLNMTRPGCPTGPTYDLLYRSWC